MSEKKAKVVKPEVQAKFGPSLLVFLLVTAVILVGILVLGLDAHIPIVIAAMIVAVYGIILHVPFKDLEHAMIKTISESVPVLLLICIVGMLIGSWMSAGTVPVIIYVGLELLRPSIFLPFVAIMCAILSTMTGSSWTTCSTIGVAFMGISVGLGIPRRSRPARWPAAPTSATSSPPSPTSASMQRASRRLTSTSTRRE